MLTNVLQCNKHKQYLCILEYTLSIKLLTLGQAAYCVSPEQ